MSQEMINKKSLELKIEVYCFMEVLQKHGGIETMFEDWEPELQWKYADLLQKRAHLRLLISFHHEFQRCRR